ncbi:MAG: citrate/2-methylcitrate synthase, partial [Pirellulales bacterium]|nr:citrate/2-methylcitrate synthase [Pirellulales bacterium]
MSAPQEKVEMIIDGKSHSFPVIVGTYNEKAIDISKLLAQTGYVTMDPGYKNTGATLSAITFIDGDAGILEHRGYPIENLAEKVSFPEVIYLLLYGELPDAAQLATFNADLKAHMGLPEGVKAVLNALPQDTHPMGMLTAVLASLTGFFAEDLESWFDESVRKRTIYRVLANMPVISAYVYRRSAGLPFIEPDPSRDYTANFMHMMFGEIAEAAVEAMDKLLILHADHEQNCSTSTVRLSGSSQTNLYSAVAAGVSALWGPLHGGANMAVLEMLDDIMADDGDAAHYIAKAKDKNDPFRLMGFGHRVYKNYDPRAKVIKKYTDKVLADLGVSDP